MSEGKVKRGGKGGSSGMKAWIAAQKKAAQENQQQNNAFGLNEETQSEAPSFACGDRVQSLRIRVSGVPTAGSVAQAAERAADGDLRVVVVWKSKDLSEAAGLTQALDNEATMPSGVSVDPGTWWSRELLTDIVKEKSITDALKAKYGDDESSQNDQSPGLMIPSTPSMSRLKSIDFRNCGIGSLASFDSNCLPSITSLDVSQNLLSSFRALAELVKATRTLTNLSAGQNPLKVDFQHQDQMADSHPSLRSLALNQIPEFTIGNLVSFITAAGLDSINDLSMCDNKIEKIDTNAGPFLANLKELRMDRNLVDSWMNLGPILSLKNLEKVVLNANPLPGLPVIMNDLTFTENITSLHLSGTKMAGWDDIDTLGKLPKLRDVRLQNLEFLSEYDADTQRMLLIAHLPNVSAGGEGRQTVGSETCGRLNGGMITASERRDAHRFFLEHWEKFEEGVRPVRYQTLQNDDPIAARLAGLNLSQSHDPDTVQKDSQMLLHNGISASSFDARGLGRCN